jgi:hypothetical protein
MTENERKIVDAASVIVETTGTLTRGMQTLEAKVDRLTEQAQAPEAAEVEDLSEEFDSLNSAVAGLQALAENLNAGVQQEDEPGDVSVSTQSPAHPADPEPPGVSVAPQTPTTTEMMEPEAPGATLTHPEETTAPAETTDPFTTPPVEDTGSSDTVPASDEGPFTDPTPVAESTGDEDEDTSEDSGDLV